jgi:hypothetical protein
MEIVVSAFCGQLNLPVTLPALHHRGTDGHGHGIAQEFLFSSAFSCCFTSHSEVTVGGWGTEFSKVSELGEPNILPGGSTLWHSMQMLTLLSRLRTLKRRRVQREKKVNQRAVQPAEKKEVQRCGDLAYHLTEEAEEAPKVDPAQRNFQQSGIPIFMSGGTKLT